MWPEAAFYFVEGSLYKVLFILLSTLFSLALTGGKKRIKELGSDQPRSNSQQQASDLGQGRDHLEYVFSDTVTLQDAHHHTHDHSGRVERCLSTLKRVKTPWPKTGWVRWQCWQQRTAWWLRWMTLTRKLLKNKLFRKKKGGQRLCSKPLRSNGLRRSIKVSW